MKHLRLSSPVVVGAICAALTAGAIGATAAARSGHSARSSTTATHRPPPGGPPHGGFAVHADEVVLNKTGTAFIAETEDSGTVASISGDQLAVKEGTKTVAYKTVTLTIPPGATIYRNGAKATLADLKVGDQVHVSQSSDGTTVFAGDKTFGPGREHGRDHRGGPPPGAPGYGG